MFKVVVLVETGSAGLVKKRCGMVSDVKCVTCDSRVGEDVAREEI